VSPRYKTPGKIFQRVLWLLGEVLLAIVTLLIIVQPPGAVGQTNSESAEKPKLLLEQHFVCNTGYSRQACHEQCERLAAVLLRYQSALPQNWTWVLVRSDDWTRILRGLDLDEQSPAFTVLSKRETFLNEALFRADARTSAQLLSDFAVPLDRVLDYSVAHELGHAFCMEAREREASLLAEQLTRTGAMQCYGAPDQNLGPTKRDTVRTLNPPR
jgi:hypothetical protein